MLLGVDLDGVVCDFVHVCNEWIHETYGHEIIPATKWDWADDYPDGKMAFRSFWGAGVEGGAFTRCPEIPDAVETLKRIISGGDDVVFVTHRNPANGPLALHTVEWLKGRGLPVNLAFLQEKELLRADFYVDDKPETIDALLVQGFEAVLFDQPWNREEQWQCLPRVHGWKELEWGLYANFEPEGLS